MEIKLVGHNVYDFNPRTREGCDLQSGHIRHISGHFNPRTREGCDNLTKMQLGSGHAFQSTHP